MRCITWNKLKKNSKRQILAVSEAQGIALSVSLVFLNTLQEDHFSPNGFALFHEKSASLCHYDK